MQFIFKLTSLEKLRYLAILSVLLYSCGTKPAEDATVSDFTPLLEPDYSDITIPPNVAPLNFNIKEKGTAFFIKFSVQGGEDIELKSVSGRIQIPERKWRRMLLNNAGKELRIDIYSKEKSGKWLKFRTITNKIAFEPIDSYLYYRLVYPGYESWSELSINFRNLESFKSNAFIENSVVGQNCVNCHSFNNGKSDDFLFHMRGSMV